MMTDLSRDTARTSLALPRLSLTGLALALSAVLALGASTTQAGIVGINTPTWSVASITFDDTNSIGPPAGVTNGGPSVSPWSGSLISLPLTTDPNTSDQASGDMVATFVPSGNLYALNFSNIFLSQPLTGTTGHADLLFQFKVEYQWTPWGCRRAIRSTPPSSTCRAPCSRRRAASRCSMA